MSTGAEDYTKKIVIPDAGVTLSGLPTYAQKFVNTYESTHTENNTVLIYEVPAGKVFYLTAAWLLTWVDAAIGAEARGSILFNDSGVVFKGYILRLQCDSQTEQSISLCFNPPVKATAAESFWIQSSAANLWSRGGIFGYEENA